VQGLATRDTGFAVLLLPVGHVASPKQPTVALQQARLNFA